MIVQSAILSGRLPTTASNSLILGSFPDVAKSDPLIIALGNYLMRQNIGNKLKRKNYTSSRMTRAAKLRCHIRSTTGTNHDMSSYLVQSYFDQVAEGMIRLSFEPLYFLIFYFLLNLTDVNFFIDIL